MKVIVVGGSIAGCAAAYYLAQAGHNVTIHERSTRLTSQGIAIGTSAAALAETISTGLLPSDFPHCESDTLDYVTRGEQGSQTPIGSVPLPWATMRWRDLHAAMRARVPSTRYLSGQTVTRVYADRRGLPAVSVGENTLSADLVVLADGNQSLARDLAPFASRRRYTSLALLRGLVPERDPADRSLSRRLIRTMFPGGHAVTYTVPGRNGRTAPGHRDVMWGIYLTVPERALGGLATTSAKREAGGAALFELTPERRSALLEPVLPLLPDSWAARIARTDVAHLQPVIDATTHTLHAGRVCAIGDAGSVYPPFNADGVIKAVRMASSLTAALPATPDDLSTALATWSHSELTTARQAHQSAEHLRRCLIDGVPQDLTSEAATTHHWLRSLHPGSKLALPSPDHTEPKDRPRA